MTTLLQAPNIALRTHEPVCRACAKREASKLLSVLFAMTLGKQDTKVLAEHLGRAVAKRPFGRRVKKQNLAVLIRADYGVRNEWKDIDACRWKPIGQQR